MPMARRNAMSARRSSSAPAQCDGTRNRLAVNGVPRLEGTNPKRLNACCVADFSVRFSRDGESDGGHSFRRVLNAPAELQPGYRTIRIANFTARLQLVDLQGERLLQVGEAAFGGIPFDRRTDRQLFHGYFLFVHRFTLHFHLCASQCAVMRGNTARGSGPPLLGRKKLKKVSPTR